MLRSWLCWWPGERRSGAAHRLPVFPGARAVRAPAAVAVVPGWHILRCLHCRRPKRLRRTGHLLPFRHHALLSVVRFLRPSLRLSHQYGRIPLRVGSSRSQPRIALLAEVVEPAPEMPDKADRDRGREQLEREAAPVGGQAGRRGLLSLATWPFPSTIRPRSCVGSRST